MTRPVVVQSLEDETGTRCVDLIALRDGAFGFRECRRDPEDGHGWRFLSAAAPLPYASVEQARAAGVVAGGWLVR